MRADETEMDLTDTLVLLWKLYGVPDGLRERRADGTGCLKEWSSPALRARAVVLIVFNNCRLYLLLDHIQK